MFKVGDKGYSCNGSPYTILSVNGAETHCGSPQPIRAEWIDQEDGRRLEGYFSEGGQYLDIPSKYDLMPPESSDENVEMPEYLPEEIEATAEYEYDLPERSIFEELADIAMRYGIPVEYDVANDVVTFNRFS